jgi:hypothetical protein
MIEHGYNPSYFRGGGRRIKVRDWWGKNTRPYLKNKLKARRTRGMA